MPNYDSSRESRLERGREVMQRVAPESGEAMLGKFDDIAPDFGDLLLGFVFADVYDRPQLSLRERQLVRIAALTALGASAGPFKANLAAAVHLEIPDQDIVEVLIQTLPYAGFPRVITALEYAKEMLKEFPGE